METTKQRAVNRLYRVTYRLNGVREWSNVLGRGRGVAMLQVLLAHPEAAIVRVEPVREFGFGRP